jgi:PPM family protein phosphatase
LDNLICRRQCFCLGQVPAARVLPLSRLEAAEAPCYKFNSVKTGRSHKSQKESATIPELKGRSLHFEIGTQSDQGRIRPSNEDSFIADSRINLYLVADGMGGHAAGEIASRIAAAAVQEAVAAQIVPDVPPEEVLRTAAELANCRIYESQLENVAYTGMGSTLTALTFRNNHYYIAHVGDSRAYRLRNGKLDQLTKDHSYVWPLFEKGALRKSELSTHPCKNLLTRAVGTHPEVGVDIEHGETCEDDVYLICSDGLTDAVPDESIQEILSERSKSARELGHDLVSAANAAGGPDNITVVVVRLENSKPSNSKPARQ